MKLHVFFLILSSSVLVACNSPTQTNQTELLKTKDYPNNSETQVSSVDDQQVIDWQGRYSGLLPCADCNGIRTTLNLAQDKTFSLTEQYIGKGPLQPTIYTGQFNFDANQPSVLSLDTPKRQFSIHPDYVEARAVYDGSPLNELYRLYKLSEIRVNSTHPQLEVQAWHSSQKLDDPQSHQIVVWLKNKSSKEISLKKIQFHLMLNENIQLSPVTRDFELNEILPSEHEISSSIVFQYSSPLDTQNIQLKLSHTS